MIPHKLTICLLLVLFNQISAFSQKRKPPLGGRLAVVVDERLAAVRATPQLNGKLVRRLGRGRLVAVRSSKVDAEGLTFLLVNVTSRTHGWIQREAVVLPSRSADEGRLLHLLESSQGFDRISRARLFLEHFSHSPLRARVLLLLGDTAEVLSGRLTREAARKIAVPPTAAPEFSYYLNHPGLDRYNRQGVKFVFDQSSNRFHYDGAAWRELIRRHPRSPEAAEARKRLDTGPG
jgi:hypothetical protein